MSKKLLLLLSICHFIFYILQAQSIRYDYGVYPPPSTPPTLPAAGGKFTDPVFGTSILRVTDANDGADNHQSYSYWPSMNKNSSLLYVSSMGGNPTLYDFDSATFSISNKRALFASNPPSGGAPSSEDAIWSGTQNNVMLCHTGQKIWSYNSSTNTYTLVKDFSVAYPNIYLAQMSRSINDSIFAFTYKENVNYTVVGWITYNASNNQTDTANLSTLDEVQVDKTGNYLVIKTGNSGPSVIEVEIKNLKTGSMQYLTDNAPDFSPGHSDNGTGFVIGADNWNNSYTFRTLANPHTFYNVLDFNNDWSLGNHVSMLCDDEAWLLVSTFKANTLASSGIFEDELFEVATDGSKNVRRLAHHHSDYLNQTNSGNAYWSSPRANLSRDGKFAVFTSNFGSTTRRDVFVLKIPVPAAVTAVAENENEEFRIFPNPTNGKFTVGIDNGKWTMDNYQLSIYNLMGEKVYEKENAQLSIINSALSIDVTSKPNGIYFVKLKTEKGINVQKISIVK